MRLASAERAEAPSVVLACSAAVSSARPSGPSAFSFTWRTNALFDLPELPPTTPVANSTPPAMTGTRAAISTNRQTRRREPAGRAAAEGGAGREGGACDETGGCATSVGASTRAGPGATAGVAASIESVQWDSGSAGANGAPQVPQNRDPSGSSLPQLVQVRIVALGKRRAATGAEALARAVFRTAIRAEARVRRCHSSGRR
jgi:hypothetical protein